MDSLAGEESASWAKDGYFVVRNFLSPSDIGELRWSCDIVLDKIRGESSALGHVTANIAYLTEPRYFAADLSALLRLLEFAGATRVRHLIENLARSGEPPLLFHNTQYFHEQMNGDWDGNWHRDSQFGMPNPEVERQFALTTTAVHFRVAFVSDDRLEFVPGSHARWDRAEEFQIRKGPVQNGLMPASVRIALEPGDACVFHAWGIHRGTRIVAFPSAGPWTLSMALVRADPDLQHRRQLVLEMGRYLDLCHRMRGVSSRVSFRPIGRIGRPPQPKIENKSLSSTRKLARSAGPGCGDC